MPKQNNSPKTYTSLDMLDIHTLAENDMEWMAVAIYDISKRVRAIKEELTERDVNAQYQFSTLETILGMYEFIADERHRHYSEAVEEHHSKIIEEHKKACAMASQKGGANHA